MNAQSVAQRTPNPVMCFDDSKMTLNAAAYAHDFIFRSAIDRIGMYQSPQALHLTIRAVRDHIEGSSFSSPVPSRQPETNVNLYSEPTAPRESTDQSVELCQSFSRSRRPPLRMKDDEIPFNASEVSSHLRYKELVDSVDVETRVCAQTNVHTHTIVCVYVCVYIYLGGAATHKHTHTHTHTHRWCR